MEYKNSMTFFSKENVGNEQYNARMFHLANTFKLHKENKLKFFYPENDNKDYSEEEEDILLRARINSIANHRVASLEEYEKTYNVKLIEEGNVKFKVLENHNIYLDNEDYSQTQEAKKVWATTVFFAICESVSKLLKSPSTPSK